MNALESRIKGLEQHIEKLYKTIEGWEKLAKEKNDIIKKYEAKVKNNVGLANVVGQSEQLKAFLQEIENDKSYIHNQYFKNKAKTLSERL